MSDSRYEKDDDSWHAINLFIHQAVGPVEYNYARDQYRWFDGNVYHYYKLED